MVATAALWGGCFDVSRDEPDAALDAPQLDATVFQDGGTERRSFGPAKRLVELSTIGDERFPSPSRNGLALTFTRTEMAGTFAIHVPYRAIRSSVEEPFGPAARFAAFGDASIWDLEMRDDELEWFFWTGLATLASARRATTSEPFGSIETVGASGFSPSLSGDALALYHIDLDGNVAALRRGSVSSPWTGPIAVDVPAPFAFESIDVSADELAIIVTADPESIFAGVYISRRSSRSESFSPPERIGALEGPFVDARFSPGEDEIFMTAPFASSDDLYHSRLVIE